MNKVTEVSASSSAYVRVLGERCVRDAGSLKLDFQAVIQLRIARCSGCNSLQIGEAMLHVTMNGGFAHFDVLIKGEEVVQATVKTTGAQQEYTFALPSLCKSGSPETEIWLVKRTEALHPQVLPPLQYLPPVLTTKSSTLTQVRVSAGFELLQHCTLSTKRKIEFVGDSDMAAFGNEGPPTLCTAYEILGELIRVTVRPFHLIHQLCVSGMQVVYQNITNSWSHALARMLNAEPSVVAWSGIGVAQNATNCTPPGGGCLLDVYLRTIALDLTTKDHDFEAGDWRPELVVVQVGGNDLYGGEPEPTSKEAFILAYVKLLEKIRQSRGDTCVILCLTYSLDTPTYIDLGAQDRTLENYTEASIEQYRAAHAGDEKIFVTSPGGNLVWPEDGGTCEHWGVRGMLKYAEAVCTFIETEMYNELGWKRECAAAKGIKRASMATSIGTAAQPGWPWTALDLRSRACCL